MKVAVVGSGIAGLACAHRLQNEAEVVLFEADARLGGHTDTHSIWADGRSYAADSGFIVFNRDNYPGFSAWLDELGVASQTSDMSFGVRNVGTGLEYGTGTLGALLCQRRNVLRPRFLRMLRDLRRFYGDAHKFADDTLTLGELVQREGYGNGFVADHLVPMCSALWSVGTKPASDIDASHVINFMTHHKMLQLAGRPEWRVVTGGSTRYVEAFRANFTGQIRVGDGVLGVERQPSGVRLRTVSGEHHVDAVVLACHSDQALAMLEDPSAAERQILGSIEYQPNRVVVHSDPSVMPRRKAAWSSWNAVADAAHPDRCQVTYWMNRLQGLPPGSVDFFVTLNPSSSLRRVWSERQYAHPVFSNAARAAQQRHFEISGVRNTFYCGAYWGWGFHEDGFASAERVVAAIGERMSHAA